MKTSKMKSDDAITIQTSIFVVSSEEALPIANAVKQQFDNGADVDIWVENIFKLNIGHLDALLNRAAYYDFCIIIFSSDDIVTARNRKFKSPRADLIFEFGLFLGRLGPRRTFFLIEEGADFFSNWGGIVVDKFKPREDMVSAVGAACHKIRGEMKVANNIEQAMMLPSTSLAVGYYNNFLSRVIHAFKTSETLTVHDHDCFENLVSPTEYKTSFRSLLIEVVVPEDLRKLEPRSLELILRRYKSITVSSNNMREFPFYTYERFRSNPRDSCGLTLVDIPSSLLSLRKAIELTFGRGFLAEENNERRIERREVANFGKTLRIMMPDDERKFFRFSVVK